MSLRWIIRDLMITKTMNKWETESTWRVLIFAGGVSGPGIDSMYFKWFFIFSINRTILYFAYFLKIFWINAMQSIENISSQSQISINRKCRRPGKINRILHYFCWWASSVVFAQTQTYWKHGTLGLCHSTGFAWNRSTHTCANHSNFMTKLHSEIIIPKSQK